MPQAKKTRSTKVSRELDDLKKVANIQVKESEALVQESPNPDSDTRQEIAKKFIRWYFMLLLILIVGVPTYNLIGQGISHTDSYRIDLASILQSYSAIVGPLIGFVIAYYFKDKK